MSKDPTEPLEAARLANRALAERVAELERQLKRFSAVEPEATSLGASLSEREVLLSEAERIAHMGSWVWDVVTNEVRWSAELYRMLGYDQATESASFDRFFARIHPEDLQRVQAASARSIASGVNERVECRLLRPDGSVRHVIFDAALLFDADGNLKRAVGATLDVTEQREAARALERTAHMLAEAQRIGKMGSFEVFVGDVRASWSDELFRILDVDPSETPSVELFMQRLHEDDRARIGQLVQRSMRSGETEPSRARVVRRDGSLHYVDMMAIPTHDAQGTLLSIRGTVADVTDLVRLEAQFHQSQKMEAIGQLAGGLAHDYNNLLMVICGNAELLLDQRESPEVREIHNAANAAISLTNRLLAFSRRAPLRTRVVQLAEDIEASKSLILRAVGDRIVTRFELAPALWPVNVDSGQVQQILLNLALNARDAMPEGGTLTLSASNRVLSGTDAQRRHERAAEYVVLQVTDTGMGMDEATRARVFEPFFSTKPPGSGTGLGLAMVFGSMKQCGGFVEVASRPRAGATFSLWFPRASEQVSVPPAAVSGLPRASGSVLLVEDNIAVANVAKLILESGGYTVQVAHEPERAIDMWRAAPADVLVTDVEMPGMSGLRLVERLRQLAPELRTLFITGHSTEAIDIQGCAGRCAVVMKPFRRRELLQALSKLLA